ncbi:MAG TPA: hypothetical protein VIF57_19475 [Polyangia bacterium]|jgi:hypothetical protein
MRIWRSWARVLCLAGGVAGAAGCTDHGSYTAIWQFVGSEPALTGCGKHGVDSIRVTGMSTAGDSENVVAVCPGSGVTHSVPVGTWTFVVGQLDARGRQIFPSLLDAQGQVVLDANNNPMPAPDPTATVEVQKDRTADPFTVDLTPQPSCRDGVDNNGDGRVDLDDPVCSGDPNSNAECPGEGC